MADGDAPVTNGRRYLSPEFLDVAHETPPSPPHRGKRLLRTTQPQRCKPFSLLRGTSYGREQVDHNGRIHDGATELGYGRAGGTKSYARQSVADHRLVMPDVSELVVLARDLPDLDPVQEKLVAVRHMELQQLACGKRARHDDLMLLRC